MSKWVKWIASFLYSSAKSREEFTENLAASITVMDNGSGWYLIESDDDIRADLQSKKERMARDSEIATLSALTARSSKDKDWLKAFADLLVNLPDDASESCFSPLPSDMRVSIVNRVMKLRSQQWLDLVERIFGEVKRRESSSPFLSPSAKALLEDLKATWSETQFAKGRIGALRDFSMLSYTEDRLTPKMLRAIHSSLVKSFQVLFRVQLQCALSGDDVATIEDSLALAIPDIITLHVQSSKNSQKTHGNEGKLPQKWREEDEKLVQKLQEIKAKGADAKWEEPVPYNPSNSPKIDLKLASDVLNKLLASDEDEESSESGSESEEEETDSPFLERLKVHIHEDERMKADDLEQRKNFLMHTLFSARRLNTRTVNAHA
jgi:hypothetical protein